MVDLNQETNETQAKMNGNENRLQETLDNFHKLSSNYDHFLIQNEDNSLKFKNITKYLYDYSQNLIDYLNVSISKNTKSKNDPKLKPLKNLFVDNFDNEQIWQQLEVFNQLFIENSISEISYLSTSKKPMSLFVKMKDSNENSKPILKPPKEKPEKVKKKVQFAEENNSKEFEDDNSNDIVDFFDLNEMEQILDEQEYKEMNKHEMNEDDDDNIDPFADMSSDEDDGKNAMYQDFFDPPPRKINKKEASSIENEVDNSDEDYDNSIDLDTRDYDFDEEVEDQNNSEDEDPINQKLKELAEDIDENEDDLNKSEYERSQLKLKRKIEKAEEDLLLPHNIKWQFAGETSASIRPTNSLLEEHLQFDHVARPAPLITDETTSNLESLIKQRIKDKVFDDVERKVKPKEQPFEFRRRVLLESEKSKIGLAEIYEQEYLKQQQKQKEQELGAKADAFIAIGEAEESETRKEIRRMMSTLFRKLDSLSAFHYTPRPPEPEVKIINNLPAVTVEEAVPDTISDMKLLAPEEVYSTRNQKVLQDKGERTKTDRNRARRLKKKKQRIKQKFLQNKLKLKTVDKVAKKQSIVEAQHDSKSLSSSTKFFERLQEKKDIGKIEKKSKPKLIPQPNLSKKLKL